MRVLAFLDQTVADPDKAQLRVDDLGLLRGDGVFETLLVAGGKARELDAHLDRLIRSAKLLDLPEPDRLAWERLVQKVLSLWNKGDAKSKEMALKLVYTRGIEGDPAKKPTGFALAQPVDAKVIRQRAEGVKVVTLERGIDEGLAQRAPWLLLGAKSLSYAINMAAVREAGRREADDAIFTTSDGQLLEGPTSTVVIARDRALLTPPSSMGLLPGTTQAALFRGAGRVGWSSKVEPLQVDDLFNADAVFLTSSVRKTTLVTTVDGQKLQNSPEIREEIVQAYESEYRA